MRVIYREIQEFTVLEYIPESHQLETTIGLVDPFVGLALEDVDPESLVGKRFTAEGFWSGVFLPIEYKIEEVK